MAVMLVAQLWALLEGGGKQAGCTMQAACTAAVSCRGRCCWLLGVPLCCALVSGFFVSEMYFRCVLYEFRVRLKTKFGNCSKHLITDNVWHRPVSQLTRGHAMVLLQA